MAAHASHQLPSGYVADKQLFDGSLLGNFKMIDSATFGATGTFDLRVRFYQGKLVAEIYNRTEASPKWVVKEREYFVNNMGYIPELLASAQLFATNAELLAIGLNSTTPLLVPPVDTKQIPYKADADGKVYTAAIPTTPEDTANANKAFQDSLISALQSNATGDTTTTTTTTTTGMASLKRWGIIGLLVIGGVVAVSWVYNKLTKRKKS